MERMRNFHVLSLMLIGALTVAGTAHAARVPRTSVTELSDELRTQLQTAPKTTAAPAETWGNDLRRARAHVTTRSVASVGAGQLRLPDFAFAPAALTSDDWPVSPSGANGLALRVNHWWSYDRLGMQTGYFQLAGATNALGDLFGFAWQAGIYSSNNAAWKSYNDGVMRTGQWQAPISCTGTLHAPCSISAYLTIGGGEAEYSVFQVNQCLGEIKAFSDSADSFNSNSDTITSTQAVMAVAGASLLKGACHGASSSTSPGAAPQPQPKPAPKPQPKAPNYGSFHGNCFSFRSTLWHYNQRAAALQRTWWSDLQRDYNGNYPPPTGGSTPGATQDQFSAAQADMNSIHLRLSDDTAHTGLEYDVDRTGLQYGLRNRKEPGRFTWAILKVIGAAYFLDLAAYDEMWKQGTGRDNFHLAQQRLSNGWDALKQLPCH